MDKQQASPTILFAGGGTGGHLFPSMAITERLAECDPRPAVHFVCSDRPLDARILDAAQLSYTVSPVRPLPRRLRQVVPFYSSFSKAVKQARGLIDRMNIAAVVAMGGFVCGPVVAAAKKTSAASILVNLDAIPGKANRWLARSCDRIYTVYDTPVFRAADRISLPLRRVCLGPIDRAEARRRLGLTPDKPVLLITGASQGATSINHAMIELTRREAFREAIAGWQIFHLTGAGCDDPVREVYQQAGIEARVVEFCDTMGDAWAGADLAISRAGAGSVAEAVANRCVCLFMPYPYHKDQHQKHNAQPAAEAGGAMILDDAIDPAANAERLIGPLGELMRDNARRTTMQQALADMACDDGARVIADELVRLLESG